MKLRHFTAEVAFLKLCYYRVSTLQSEQQWHGFKQTDRNTHRQTEADKWVYRQVESET